MTAEGRADRTTAAGSAGSPCRVLALDGGGMRGTFTAAALAELELVHGPQFLDSFDLVVGTSTGGILALGLASGRSAVQMLAFYQEAGPRIFSRPRRIRSLLSGPVYDREPLDEALRAEFGKSKMNELLRPVCVTAYELVTGTPRVWKDDHAVDLHGGGVLPVWAVAAATAAAPTYFAPVRLGQADIEVDGGVWANNPAIVGLVEAVRYLGRPLSEIRLLSIGTTGRPLRMRSLTAVRRMGRLQWGFKALPLLMASSSSAVDRQAALLLRDNYLRLDSDVADAVSLDSVADARHLEEWGRDVARRHKHEVAALLGL